MKTDNKQKNWYKLDNAAKIFPGQSSKTWSNIFRISVVIDRNVDPVLLEKSLKQTLKRFPCLKVKLKNGLFWHYLVENELDAPPVMEDINNPCHRVNKHENDGFLFRIYYRANRISIDLYHVLSDGYGCAIFIFSLIGQYYRLLGENIPFNEFVLDVENTEATAEETEDSFLKYATSKAKYKRLDKHVYHPDGTKLPAHMVNIISGTVSFKELHKITVEKDVTVTEYIAALLLKIHIEKQKKERRKQKEVCIQVPINLRKTFGAHTLRNFSICLRVKIDPNRGEYSFDELLKLTALQLRLANNRNDMNMMITANTKLERNKFLKYTPLFIKDFGIKISFLLTGEETTTSLLSNIGYISLPEELSKHIEKCTLMPGPGLKNPARIGLATTNDNLTFTFASFQKECDIQRDFFTFLVKQGLNVKIESNK